MRRTSGERGTCKYQPESKLSPKTRLQWKDFPERSDTIDIVVKEGTKDGEMRRDKNKNHNKIAYFIIYGIN